MNQQVEFDCFVFNDLILCSDGGVVIVVEQYFVYQCIYCMWDGIFQFDEFYNYNDIIVVNIRLDGFMEWFVCIFKWQEIVNDGGYYFFYVMVVVWDWFYFIFNDNSCNYILDNDNFLYNFNGRNFIIMLVEICKGGEFEMYLFFNNWDVGVIICLKICK